MSEGTGHHRHIVVHLREVEKGLLISPVFFEIVRGKRRNVHLGHWVTVPVDRRPESLLAWEKAIVDALSRQFGA